MALEQEIIIGQFLFIVGYIWTITSVMSVVIGPFVGLNRKAIRKQSADIWRAFPITTKGGMLRFVHAFAFLGFLLPAAYPAIGLIVGVLLVIVSQE